MLEAGDYDKKVKAKIELKGGISRVRKDMTTKTL